MCLQVWALKRNAPPHEKGVQAQEAWNVAEGITKLAIGMKHNWYTSFIRKVVPVTMQNSFIWPYQSWPNTISRSPHSLKKESKDTIQVTQLFLMLIETAPSTTFPGKTNPRQWMHDRKCRNERSIVFLSKQDGHLVWMMTVKGKREWELMKAKNKHLQNSYQTGVMYPMVGSWAQQAKSHYLSSRHMILPTPLAVTISHIITFMLPCIIFFFVYQGSSNSCGLCLHHCNPSDLKLWKMDSSEKFTVIPLQ